MDGNPCTIPHGWLQKQENQNKASRRNFFQKEPSGRAAERAKHMELAKRPPNVLQNTVRLVLLKGETGSCFMHDHKRGFLNQDTWIGPHQWVVDYYISEAQSCFSQLLFQHAKNPASNKSAQKNNAQFETSLAQIR